MIFLFFSCDLDNFSTKDKNDKTTKKNVGPLIVKPLSSIRAKTGENLRMECIITGHPTPDVKWFLDELEIDLKSKNIAIVSFPTKPDHIQATLNISSCRLCHGGLYKLVAVNQNGTASSSANVVIINEDNMTGFYFLRS